ncbi:MAG: hypothetical protein ILP19_07490, partial [Oscillospiraceae bacterium]|nr:hypothetical protein [Oscillospiraceae bacterium]
GKPDSNPDNKPDDKPDDKPAPTPAPNMSIDTTPWPEDKIPTTPNLVAPIYGPDDKYGRNTPDGDAAADSDSAAQTEDVGAGAGVEDAGSHGTSNTDTAAMVLIICLIMMAAAIGGAKFIERKK